MEIKTYTPVVGNVTSVSLRTHTQTEFSWNARRRVPLQLRIKIKFPITDTTSPISENRHLNFSVLRYNSPKQL